MDRAFCSIKSMYSSIFIAYGFPLQPGSTDDDAQAEMTSLKSMAQQAVESAGLVNQVSNSQSPAPLQPSEYFKMRFVI